MKASTRRTAAQQLVGTAQSLLKESEELRTMADLSSDPAEQLRLLEAATLKAYSAREIGEKARGVAKGKG